MGTAANPTAVDGVGPNLVEGRELNLPAGVALDNTVSPPNVYISDSGNNRVLGYRYTTQLKAGSIADVVIGQLDRFGNQSSASTGRSTGMNAPSGLAVDSSGNLYVADTGNNRILRYANPLAQNGGSGLPNMVIGQQALSGRGANSGGLSATSLALSTTSTFRSGLAFDSAGNLWVADTGNNRVLRFPVSALRNGANNPSADLVLGQADFVSHMALTVRTSKSGLIAPQGLAFDAAGRLLVTDGGLRVVVYPAGVPSSGLAIRLIGLDQTVGATNTTQIALLNPLGVTANSTGVIVADTGNNRLLSFSTVDNFPAETTTQISPTGTAVLGQPSYAVSKANQGLADSTSASFNAPVDIASSSTEYFVVDAQNNRVLVFPLTPGGIGATATRVIGQLDFPYNATNLIEGKEFAITASGASATGSAILDQSSTPPHLYVADTQNNRILGFKDFTHLQNGQAADLVIGQPDFFRAQVNYPGNDASLPNAAGLHSPTSLAVDSAGNLYVADAGNSRILRFPAPFASGRTNLESADLVIGQSDFRSIVTDASAQNLDIPLGIALTADGANASVSNSGYLVVADSGHNRVLLFPKPFSNALPATRVLGQSNFTSSTGGSDLQHFSIPRGVAVDSQDRLLVADTLNHRVEIFNKAGSINNFDTALNSITTGLSQPVGISANNNGFWVADAGANAAVHFPTADQLLIKGNASDATQPALQPLSVFTDTYNNLVVADSANRVLYFAPQLSVVSAADYSPRALTAGSIASIYPSVTGNVVAAGTANFNSVIPLPTSLADTQVLVNGTPAPLFYASPGQINFVLPQALPTGGTADVQAVRQSTGQVFGAAEIALAAADPALFTLNSSGSGQVAALNYPDNSVNGPLNPVARGQIIVLYGTGIGPVANAPPDGQANPGATPAPDKPQILIGSATTFVDPANIIYSGLAPTLVGVWQINLTIPSDATVGSSVPIKIFEGSIPNFDTANSLGNATIAIK